MKRHQSRILPSEITPPEVYFDRRRLLGLGLASLAAGGIAGNRVLAADAAPGGASRYAAPRNKKLSIGDRPNSYEDATTYNNFYEFGTGKSDPAANAQQFRTTPWTVTVAGECEDPGEYALEDILKPLTFEERVYRLRCVEAWSMVIPWVGFPLADLIKRFRPTSKAKHVAFTTLHDPKQMPGQRYRVLDWPYVEGLRMDEAMHPLTLMVVGLYGKILPNQNGAPLRLVVPWKYGFKNIKSIVRIEFTERQPRNSWQIAAPTEYGYYANVNPKVNHPRWSQATERRIGGSLFAQRHDTEMFNGYGDQVASLYSGMDLRRNF